MIPVMHVITRLTVGGSSENTVSIIEELQRFGYASTLVLGPQSEGPTVDDARRRGCRIVELDGMVREVSPRRDLAAVLQLYRLFRRERPAIVHTHTSKAGFVGRFAAWLAGVPAVIHQPHGHIFYGYWGARKTALFVMLERVAARWTDTIVTLTPTEVEEHLARGIGRRAQFAVVPSGVPTAALRDAVGGNRLGGTDAVERVAADRRVAAGEEPLARGQIAHRHEDRVAVLIDDRIAGVVQRRRQALEGLRQSEPRPAGEDQVRLAEVLEDEPLEERLREADLGADRARRDRRVGAEEHPGLRLHTGGVEEGVHGAFG